MSLILDIDSVFLQGHGHAVCQDYAMTRHDSAWLADGCSQVLDRNGNDVKAATDVGARILANVFSSVISSAAVDQLLALSQDTSMRFRCRSIAGAMFLSDDILKATVGGVAADDSRFAVSLWGDGGLCLRDKNGDWSLIRLDFETLPRYAFDNSTEVVRPTLVAGNFDVQRLQLGYPFQAIFSFDDYSAVALLSDGVFSFTRATGSYCDVSEAFLRFFGLRGRWCSRHLRGFIKEQSQQGIMPFDDISMAGISLR